ncbi:DUF2292 domain-containing protein [Candidatus Amesbacteria bacterium]|nr:DUF2292 domain-containing protein [Candidatus Amesbacteria bacterium]MBI2587608.1 DUF2292 domain-containing protein [Candidatus Amesbacteria bacterium]
MKKTLTNEILAALTSVQGYGSVEIYVNDRKVTQITVRNIKKTNSPIPGNGHRVKMTIDKPISLY